MYPVPVAPQKQPAQLSIGDGFSFGCGFVVASVLATIGMGVGFFLLTLLIGAIASR